MKNKSALLKTINWIVNIILVLIMLAALSVLLMRSSLFGFSYYGVLTDSMDGGYAAETGADGNYYPPSFKPGDLIIVKSVSANAKQNLKPGQIITFYQYDAATDRTIINTHRIMERLVSGDVVAYYTAGDNVLNQKQNNGEKKDSVSEYFADNNPSYVGYDDNQLAASDIIGVYSTKIKGLGTVINFMQSKSGFLTLVVVPCAALLIYSLYMFIGAFSKYSGEKQVALIEGKKDKELASLLEEEKEKIRAELLEKEREKIRAELLAEAAAQKDGNEDETENK